MLNDWGVQQPSEEGVYVERYFVILGEEYCTHLIVIITQDTKGCTGLIFWGRQVWLHERERGRDGKW